MAKRYTVRYELDESGTWVATIPKLPGCVTQGRSIAQARKRVREALAAYTGDARSAKAAELVDDIDVNALGSEHAELVGQVQRERAELEAKKQAALRSTARAARKLAKAGLSVRDVGELLGLSHQRVQQLLERSHAA
jgi:predicted RNase H-like HicB family nuclease